MDDRDHVHNLVWQNQYADTPLFAEREFSMFFGATDALWDTYHSIGSFWRLEWPDDHGYKLLLAWGYLQSLTIMTDAVLVIADLAEKRDPTKRNDCWFKKHPKLNRVREFRNKLGGHPALSTIPKKQPSSSAIIAVVSFAKNSWQYQIYADPDEEGKHKSFEGENASYGHWDVAANTKEHLQELEKMLEDPLAKIKSTLEVTVSTSK